MTLDDIRAAFHDYARTHHPDRGGDPEAFRLGVAAYDALTCTDPRSNVVFYKRRSRLSRLLGWPLSPFHRRPRR